MQYGEKIDFIASENRAYFSEEGIKVLPNKLISDIKITDYHCIILPGSINPLPALYNDKLIQFLENGRNTDIVFAAISSAPLLLAKAEILKGKKFTAGCFMQMVDIFPFIEKGNFIHKGIMSDGNVITGIGMFFREFAEAVLQCFDYDIPPNFMHHKPSDYTEQELTFY